MTSFRTELEKELNNADSKTFASYLMERAIDMAFIEDLGPAGQDITTDSIVNSDLMAEAAIILKQPAVVAGLEIVSTVMKRCDERVQLTNLIEDGEAVQAVPCTIMEVRGPADAILKGERLSLNILQRMCAVATITQTFVSKAKPLGIAILDTRKTTPCMRAFEKYAVRIAGGTNHRFGLFDHVLIKENHIRAAGSITRAVAAVRSHAAGKNRAIQVEVETLDELQEAIDCNVESVLLDNMSPDMVRQSIQLLQGRAKLEVSGGISLNNIDNYLIAGVDRISIGALTHSAPAVDISLELKLL